MASVWYSPERDRVRNDRMCQWRALVQGANRPQVSERRKSWGDRRRADREVTLRQWTGEGLLGPMDAGRVPVSTGGQGQSIREPQIFKAPLEPFLRTIYVLPAVGEG